MIWLMAGLALAQTPLRTAAIQAVETFEARELPRPPASTDRRAMLPWVEAMKSLLADHQAAVAAVESLDESDREAGLALLARVSTHLAELASSADRERLTPGRDDLASALDERAAEAWLGVMHHAAEVGVWGAAAEQARLWIIERDPALLEEVALPWSLAWRRAPCSERQLRVSTLTTWRGELARGCRALEAEPEVALAAFTAVVESRPKRSEGWLGLAQAQRILGHEHRTSLEAALSAKPRDAAVRWALALQALDDGDRPDLGGRWPRAWREALAALQAASESS